MLCVYALLPRCKENFQLNVIEEDMHACLVLYIIRQPIYNSDQFQVIAVH